MWVLSVYASLITGKRKCCIPAQSTCFCWVTLQSGLCNELPLVRQPEPPRLHVGQINRPVGMTATDAVCCSTSDLYLSLVISHAVHRMSLHIPPQLRVSIVFDALSPTSSNCLCQATAFFYVDMLIFIWMWQTLMLCGSDVYFTETYWEKNINQQQYQHIGVLYRWSCDKEQQSSVLSFSPRGWLNVGEHSHKKTD